MPVSRKAAMTKVRKAVQSGRASRPPPEQRYRPTADDLERAAIVIAAYQYELRDLHGVALQQRLASLAAELAKDEHATELS